MPPLPASPLSPAPFAAMFLLLAVITGLFLHLRRTGIPLVDSPAAAAPQEEPAPGTYLIESLGNSVEGRPLLCHVFGKGHPLLLLKASIHGSEGAGTPLALRTVEWLQRNPGAYAHCRIAILPVANPDGFAEGRRFNARGVDLNRNFPAANREVHPRFGTDALSEPESRALHDWIVRHLPDLIVTIHQPLDCVDYDGPDPAAALAQRLSATTGLPVEKLGTRPGSLGAWFGETLQRPIVTLELPPIPAPDPEWLWNRYGDALLDLLRHPEHWTAGSGIPATP